MRIDTVCILGGTGFVGRHLATRLHAMGKRVKVLTRRRERHRDLLVLPMVQIVEVDVQDPQALAAAFAGMDCVVNLVGILNEQGSKGEGFRRAHVELTRKVVDACKQQKVPRLLQMSALNAGVDKEGCHYLQTKGEAEQHALTSAGADLKVTAFRPSVIFGVGDGLYNRFADLLMLAPVLPLACADARFQPVFVGDVVEAMVESMDDESTYGKALELVGPTVYTLREIVEYTARVMGLRRWVVGLPGPLARMQAFLMEFVPGKPFSRDNYASLQFDSVGSGGPTCKTPVEAIVPRYLGEGVDPRRMQQALERLCRLPRPPRTHV